MIRQMLFLTAVIGLGLAGCDKPPADSHDHAGQSHDHADHSHGAASKTNDSASAPSAASRPAGESAETAIEADSQGHHHEAMHGGKLVELGGDHIFVEICLNANMGEIAIYINDCTNPIRISQPTIELHAAVPGFSNAKHTFDMSIPARENPLTGEKTGDSAEFRGRHEHLRELASLDGVIAEITVRGKKYENVKFSTDIVADK